MYDEFLNDLSRLLDVEAKEITPESQLQDFRYWDSLTLVSTIGLIDQHFKVSISGLELDQCKTIHDIFALISHTGVPA